MIRPTLLSLALALPAWGADPPPAPVVPVARITAPASVPAGTPIEVRSTGSLSVKPLKFKLISPKGVPFEVWVKADNSETMGVVKAEVTLATPGPFKFALVATGTEDNDFDFAEVAVAPVAPAPAPVPPVVPPVVVPPVPVVVPPAPAPAPSAVGSLRVLILYESSLPITPQQRAVMFSTTTVIPYLESKCMKGADGRAEWRIWDRDIDPSAESAEWRSIMATAKADPVAIPKILTFAGTTLVGSRTLVSEADTLSYLQSIGGK